MKSFQILTIFSATMVAITFATPGHSQQMKSGYADVNGLHMYYEIHGEGQPLVLVHGALMTLEGPIRELAARLSADRQVIIPEMQAHGRTADIDRPLSYEQMADDVAALIQHLKIPKADIIGYSMGGGVALQLCMRHPELVRKQVVISAAYHADGCQPGALEMIQTLDASMFAGSPFVLMYDSLAPDPDFAGLLDRIKALDARPLDWSKESIDAIEAPTMIVAGDADFVTVEHAAHLFRLAGGGHMGDMTGLSNARLAILPGTTHMGVMEKLGLLVPMLWEFLGAQVK